VSAAQQDDPQDMIAARTVRHHFLCATGMSQNHIYQIERAKLAAALLEQGVSILDTMYQVGYFDQPHLTRALKQWVGHTPAEIIRMSTSA
jgi:methylphosphotriester-DNA--protein-cysteine methyltransferase